MPKPKHTPGPWTAIDGGAVADLPHFAIETEPMTQYRVADVYQEANSRLIAAAPEMLDALKRIVRAYDQHDATDALEEISAPETRALLARLEDV